jgi:dipeptidyl aminopeptidase/acylaminoacyl peptidase
MPRRKIRFHTEGETLVGDLVLPDGEGPCPGMVFVAGTGSQDRHGDVWMDGRWYRHGTFRLISDRLAGEGIASLCWDKRGVGESTGGDRSPGDPPGNRDAHANVLTDVADAMGALHFLRDQPEIDPNRLIVWGKSAGVYFSSLLAARTDLPAAYVFLGGLYRDLPAFCEFLYTRLLDYCARGEKEEAWVKQVAPDFYLFAHHWQAHIEAARQGEEVYEAGEGEAEIRIHLSRIKHEMAHPPAEQFRHVKKPTLVIHGDQDYNVPLEDCFDVVRALKEGGNPDVSVLVVPGADHSMQVAPADTDADTRLREQISKASFRHPMSKVFLDGLAEWLTHRFVKG